MNINNSGRQIRAWAAVGAMSNQAIFDRFDQDIIDNPPFSPEELSALERSFESASDNTGHVSKATFTRFVLSQGDISPSFTEAAGVLFDSLCYLSTAPLQTTSPPHDYLTLKGLKRALVWSFPYKVLSAVTTISGYRYRSPADHRRLIFQSLATSYHGRRPPFDIEVARALAADNARDLPPDFRGGPVDDADVNFDDDGDEMYHDVLDFLALTQPYVPPTFAEPCRDGFRDLATKFHKDAPSLLDLAIPRPRLKLFLSLLLKTNLKNRIVDCAVDADLELQSAAQSMEACFYQSLSLETQAPNSPAGDLPGPFDGCTWPMFNFAISKLLPHLFDSFYSLLSTIFFNQPCRFDANTGYAKPGAILTLPRMVQVESFLYNSICMSEIRRFECNTITAGLIKAIRSIKECALLIISGHTAANKMYVFGVFIARPPIDGPCIQNGGSDFDETALLFQLSPTHDVFRGKIGIPALYSDDDGCIFGNEYHGAALALDASLINARFTHRLLEADAKAVYAPTAHRGDFETLLFIDGFEVWGECA